MVAIRPAVTSDVPGLVALAARTFPLACPPGSSRESISAHIAAQLGPDQFSLWLASPDHRLLVAESGQELAGYALMVRGLPSNPDVATAVAEAEVPVRLELSKIYLDAQVHGLGVSRLLMDAALAAGADLDPASAIWLGTNAQNARAQAFYRRHGFVVVGTRTFVLGDEPQHDVVMVRAVAAPPTTPPAQ